MLAQAFDNGAPHSRLPALGWSSWVALGPGDDHPVFDYCDENSVKAAADAFMEVGLYEAGYRHLHLDDCWAAKERNATGYSYPEKDHFPNGMKPVIDCAPQKAIRARRSWSQRFGAHSDCASRRCSAPGPSGSSSCWSSSSSPCSSCFSPAPAPPGC